jgi:hypothetical protein
VLSRETAKLRLPLDSTTGGKEMIARLGMALTGIQHGGENKIEPDLIAAPQSTAEYATSHEKVEVMESFEHVDADLSADASTDDAATMAGRLRPATSNR